MTHSRDFEKNMMMKMMVLWDLDIFGSIEKNLRKGQKIFNEILGE